MTDACDYRIAADALDLVGRQRQDTYGDPTINLGRTAAMWSAYLGKRVDSHDVAQMMVLLKVSRSRHTYNRDNYVDQVAYTLIAERLCDCE